MWYLLLHFSRIGSTKFYSYQRDRQHAWYDVGGGAMCTWSAICQSFLVTLGHTIIFDASSTIPQLRCTSRNMNLLCTWFVAVWCKVFTVYTAVVSVINDCITILLIRWYCFITLLVRLIIVNLKNRCIRVNAVLCLLELLAKYPWFSTEFHVVRNCIIIARLIV